MKISHDDTGARVVIVNQREATENLDVLRLRIEPRLHERIADQIA